MSFGFGVGDFLAVAKLANDIWQKLHDSVDQFAAILSKQKLAPKQAQGLAASGNACRNVLEDLQKLVDKYDGFTNEAHGLTANIRKATKKLKWDQDDARDLRARITSTITVLRALSESLARDEQARRELCQWLSPLDFPAQQREVYSRRQERSGHWLPESERFKIWLKSEGGVLFCPGNPGAGKTVLASIVINFLWNKVRTDDVGVAYIYCDYLKYREQTPLHLAGSLLKQLADQQNPISESIKDYYDGHKCSNTDPSPEGAFEVLKAECDNWSRIFIIIDALDECSEKDSTRKTVINGLRSLQGSKVVNILVTLRPIPSILCDLKVSERLDIRANSEDIQRYLVGQMERFDKHVLAGTALQEKIISGIVNAADGMFLLARLMFDSLVGQITRKAIKHALDNLSRGSSSLDSAYDEAMKRIEDQHPARRDLAKRALLWIIHGQRSLSVAEMQQAVAIELGEPDIDPDNTVDCDDIISACKGLITRDTDVEVLTNEGRRRTRRSDILRLVDYTAREYLERTKTKYFPKAQEYLASSCLTYLLFDVFSGAICSQSDAFGDRSRHEAKELLCFGSKSCWTVGEHEIYNDSGEFLLPDIRDADFCWNARDKEYPFYAYAAWYWGYHTENCDDEDIRTLTGRFLDDHKRVSGALHFVRKDETEPYQPVAIRPEDCNPWSALQLAAYLGLAKITLKRLEDGFEPDVKDWSGVTPLSWAAYRGHQEVVKLLLTCEDVNPNVSGHRRRTSLVMTVLDGNTAIVQLPLAYEYIEVNAKDYLGLSVLMYAIRLGQDCRQMLKLLLFCANINVNLKSDRGITPLMKAVAYEDGEITRLLLAHGDIQVNIRGEKGRTALHFGATQRNAEALRILLAQEYIQVNIRDNRGSTALHVAVKSKWELEVLQLLLAREDLEVNATNDRGESALFGAVRNAPYTSSLNVAELFLARGDVDGYSPLYHAICSGQPDVAHLLLKREDLEISVEDGEVGRLISVAENLRDEEWEDERVDPYNAIIILLRSYSEQRSSNTTSANLKQWIPERLAHIDDDKNDAAHRTDNVQIIQKQILDLVVGDSMDL